MVLARRLFAFLPTTFLEKAAYNQSTIQILLTYLQHQHRTCISINIISCLACVIPKVLITAHQHTYYVFQSYYLVYNVTTRVFPSHVWRRDTICLTCQCHCMSNPRLRCYRIDRLYYSCVYKL